ncbi:unnamed protein product [Adineta ricciae]|uniref:Palmitoyl-protein hydrolase n=1 Tax=Adineta ricciae TaxID=249248 RepID=A0A815ZDJ0_ADIRI|nr:unnamed protein product [Adineta ricciae]
MHSITSTASAMEDIARGVRSLYPDIYVVSIEIGNGKVDSYLLPLDVQVEKFCESIDSNPRLREGFNLLGYSQGSIIARGAVECCSLPVYNLITLSDIHQDLLTKYAYVTAIQNAISPANYWRDPEQLDRYYSNCHYLSDINNERGTPNGIYRENILKLNSFVMTYSNIDEVVMPRQSGLFMGYMKNSLEIETWNNSRQFTTAE